MVHLRLQHLLHHLQKLMLVTVGIDVHLPW
jgi:hypothetical protein